MLDSGLFESQVRGETTWSSEEYVEVRNAVPHDILFSFDAPTEPRTKRRSPVKPPVSQPRTETRRLSVLFMGLTERA